MEKTERIALYQAIRKSTIHYSEESVELGIMSYAFDAYNYEGEILCDLEALVVKNILKENQVPTDIETIVELFEALIDQSVKDENGIVFTPKYIADYIVENTLCNLEDLSILPSIIDPACGCGIFLVSAVEYLHKKFGISVHESLKMIHGADIEPSNTRRCKLVMALLCAKYGEEPNYNANILCIDSLKEDWCKTFSISSVDYVIGNPPYVNPHDMSKETADFLKKTYSTTKSGVFNIFYAFIECAMNYIAESGVVGFILPNNLLTIKSALELRDFLQKNAFVKSIVDFADNMVFKPTRTYNCIMILNKSSNSSLAYAVVPKTERISDELSNLHFSEMPTEALDKNGWKLADEKTRYNLNQIEGQPIPIKEFVRTGIATLKDGVYFVDADADGFFKVINGEKRYIEPTLVKPIYKISELKLHDSVDDAKRYIIFPYVKTEVGYQLIDESVFRANYPLTYECLLAQREELDARDKGRGIPQGWYAYGRTQGLNKYGKKILFPTFAKKPKFLFVDNEDALFCNGYAVFENNTVDLLLLEKVLNSVIMDYYIRNSSYSIEGGYYCYQKKYIEKFSIPCFSQSEQEFILSSSMEAVNNFLTQRYGIAQ